MTTQTAKSALTTARLVACGVMALDISGVIAADAKSEFSLDMMYIFFMFGIFFLTGAACTYYQSRAVRAITVVPFLVVAFGPVVEHILTNPVAVM